MLDVAYYFSLFFAVLGIEPRTPPRPCVREMRYHWVTAASTFLLKDKTLNLTEPESRMACVSQKLLLLSPPHRRHANQGAENPSDNSN